MRRAIGTSSSRNACGLFRPEFQAEFLIARRNVDRQERTIAGGHDSIVEVGGLGDRQRLRLKVVDDESAAALLVRVIADQLDPIDRREVGI